MMNGAPANMMAVRIRRGGKHFFITAESPQRTRWTQTQEPARSHLGVLSVLRVHCVYSVINGSNVQSASVTKTASKQVSSTNHIVAVGSSGGEASSATVPRTPAIITGTVIGY